jgi:hypothetical protein
VGTNLAYHLDPETTGRFVRAIESSLDLIDIWSIFLLGIGFVPTTKAEPSTAIMWPSGIWFKLITSGLAALYKILGRRRLPAHVGDGGTAHDSRREMR